MYYNDHEPPHFHARYQGNQAIYDFEGNCIAGEMPKKQERLIAAWAVIHTEDLEANWELAKNNEQPFRIDPLK